MSVIASSARDIAPRAYSRLMSITEVLSDVLAELAGAGLPLTECYVDGALMSIRIAAGAIRREQPLPPSERGDGSFRVAYANGMPVDACARMSEGRWEVTVREAQSQAISNHKDLGAELLADDEARVIASTDIGAAFLVDTLSLRRFSARCSPTGWWIGSAGARSIVGALRGGRAAPLLVDDMAGRLPEAHAISMINRLGWNADVDLAVDHDDPSGDRESLPRSSRRPQEAGWP